MSRHTAPVLCTAGFISLQLGDPDAAAELLAELERDLDTGTYDRVYGMMDGVRLARMLGDVDCAARIARVAPDTVPDYPFGRAVMLASEAEVSEARGEYDAAVAAYEQVIESWDRLGQMFQRAMAMLGAARCLAALGRTSEATSRASAAHGVFASLGAGTLAAETSSIAAGTAPLGT